MSLLAVEPVRRGVVRGGWGGGWGSDARARDADKAFEARSGGPGLRPPHGAMHDRWGPLLLRPGGVHNAGALHRMDLRNKMNGVAKL